MPVLKFHDLLHYSDTSYAYSDDETRRLASMRFVKFVLNLRYDSDIHTFYLNGKTSGKTSDVDDEICQWMTYAARHNVRELSIEAKLDDFEIPQCLCTCESLTKIKLDLTGLYESDSRIILPPQMSLPRLKSLRLNLEAIWFYEDEKLMNSIKNLTVSLPKLKYFVWHHDSNSSIEVKLHAPNLLSLIIRIYYGSTSFALENLSSLVTADIGPVPVEEDQVSMMRLLRGIHTVEVLELNDSFIAALSRLFSEAPNISDTQLPKFHNLQRLELETCFLREYLHTIICILKNSPNIESFSLCNLQQFRISRVKTVLHIVTR